MIRDYKFVAKPAHKRRRSSRRVFFATGILAATIATVAFLDLNSVTKDLLASPSVSAPSNGHLPLSSPLALPDRQNAAVAAEQPAAISAEPMTRQTAPLALPLLKSAIVEPRIAEPRPPQVEPAPSVERHPVERPTAPLVEQPPQRITVDADREPAAPSILATAPQPAEAEVAEQTPAELSATDTALTPVEASDYATPRWVEHAVVSGDSLAKIFSAQDLEPALLHRIVNSSKTAKSLGRIRPGQTLRFRFDELGELTRLEHHRSRIESLNIGIDDDAVTAEIISKAVDTQTAAAAGVIGSSLFVDGQKAGLSDAKIMELADIFGWDIDFALEIRAGDQFRVVYEEQFLEGEKLRDGPILAAEFTNRGNTYRAVRYESEDGEVGYFDDTGHSKRRAFLRTPIKFARISSRYNPKRWHPVLKRWRSHKGVDYAAPTGTPIKASGDGKVIFRGTKGGYGRTVVIQHAGKYTTLYAHMSKYSKRSKRGARVKQGQVIGYVGKSGLATGPHLHYEFRVNGNHKDPLRVKLPKSLSLPKQEIAAFKKATAPLLAKLDAVPADTMVASVDAEKTN